MLKTRVLTALVGIPLFLLAIVTPGGWLLALALSLLAWAGLLEFTRVYNRAGELPRIAANPVLLTWGALLPLLPYWEDRIGDKGAGTGLWLERSLLLALGFGFLWELGRSWRHPTRAVAYNLGLGLFAALYVGWLMAFGTRLRMELTPVNLSGWTLERGALGLLWLMAMLWLGDSTAYFVGRAIGRHRLAPALSPSKSWEGAIANLACCLLVGLIGADWLRLPLWKAGLIGAGVGVLGQLGDLFESSLKRAKGVKDFGGVLPGHGGVLDRFDSFLFSAPWVWWWLGN
ncbi:Phosphatidate cytidylyltransferase [bacterium HR15]|nr:Phosphatidate cytidylyltransferase [bacterium HR15]